MKQDMKPSPKEKRRKNEKKGKMGDTRRCGGEKRRGIREAQKARNHDRVTPKHSRPRRERVILMPYFVYKSLNSYI